MCRKHFINYDVQCKYHLLLLVHFLLKQGNNYKNVSQVHSLPALLKSFEHCFKRKERQVLDLTFLFISAHLSCVPFSSEVAGRA